MSVDVKVIERPAEFSFSLNEIRYVFQNQGTTAILFLQVRLYYLTLGSAQANEVLLETFNLKPDAQSKVYFYINAYLDSLLNLVVPGTADTYSVYTNANDQARLFRIEFRGVTSIDDPTEFILSEPFRAVVKGGVEEQRYSRDNYFKYQAINKSFFTWLGDKNVSIGQPIWLTCLLRPPILSGGDPDTAANKTFKIQFVFTGAEGTTAVKTITVTSTDHCFLTHIDVRLYEEDLATYFPDEKLIHYRVVVRDADDVIIAQSNLFYIEYRPVYKYYDLVYSNSLGGFDSLRVKGQVTKSFSREFNELDGGMQFNASASRLKKGTVLQSGNIRSDVFKGDAGWCLNGPDEQERTALELAASASIWQIIDDRYCQLANIQKSADLYISDDTRWSLPVEWQLAFNNVVFTPGNVPLGISPDTEIYT